MKCTSLFYKEGNSDKEYYAEVTAQDNGFVVNFAYGRRGGTLTNGTKTPNPVSETEAEKIYNKLIKEKISKGYTQLNECTMPFEGTQKESRITGLVPQLLNPIEESQIQFYIDNDDYWMQEKFDGKRVMIQIKDQEVIASNRKGLSITIPSLTEKSLQTLNKDCVLDGELIGETFFVFDLLELGTKDFRQSPYHVRYDTLSELIGFGNFSHVNLVDTSRESNTKAIFCNSWRDSKEGVVFKNKNSLYAGGRPNSGGPMIKCKFWESCTAEVTEVHKSKRSVYIALLDEDELVSVGKVTIPPNYEVPEVGVMVEVKYLYAYPKGALIQPQYLGERDDKCCADQYNTLKIKSGEGEED